MKSWFVQTCLKQMKINQSIASMLYDLGLLIPSRRTLHRDMYRTFVLSYMNLHNAWQNEDSLKKKKTVIVGLDNTWRACNRKKGTCKIYYLWVTVITPDIRQIWQEKSNGKLKMELFHMKKSSIQIRSQHSPKLCYKPEIGGNKPLFWQNYIKSLSFWHVTPLLYRQCC